MMNARHLLLVTMAAGALVSCSRQRSNSTGWDYNNPKNGGFQRVPYLDQETGPGLVFVEGGRFTMGRNEQDVVFDNDNQPRTVTVSSFYLDQFEVTNFHWLEYLYWLRRAYPGYPLMYTNALPDTLVWRSPLAYMETYVDYYLRHPAYRDYPVVGVSWLQASDYCKWRTDRVNEYILIREGLLQWDDVVDIQDEPFTTDAYLQGQYEKVANKLPDLNPMTATGGRGKKAKYGERNARIDDGILLPRYRLPTEAEWEFAYYGLIGNLQNPASEVISDKRIYPWNGHWVRQDDKKFMGDIRANFVRGRGDYMGIAGHLNDNGDVTTPVDAYWPNDYGLYHMAGNVSEWTMDVYRPMSLNDFDEFRPFRGNVYTTKLLNNQGAVEAKSEITIYDVHLMKEYLHEFERIRYQRISREAHDPNDSIRTAVFHRQKERNGVIYGEPDRFYLSANSTKDSVELGILSRIHEVLDRAIVFANKKFLIEASQLIQDEIFDGIFEEVYRESPSGDEYPYYQIIPVIRDKFSEFIVNAPGRLRYREVATEENIDRMNYRYSDYRDFKDGDLNNSQYYPRENLGNNQEVQDVLEKINSGVRDEDLVMYQSEHEQTELDGNPLKEGSVGWPTTLISDESRVYKGGSWADRAYWITGSARRYLDQRKAMATIGFRCAMDRLGSPEGMGKRKRK